MLKKILFNIILVATLITSEANALDVVGWHWYNEVQEIKDKKDELISRVAQMSPQQQMKLLQSITKSLKDQAILSGEPQDIYRYKQIQDFWVNKATQFTMGWEKMLLNHPELNYALSHPSANILASAMQSDVHDKEEALMKYASENLGLLVFYRKGTSQDAMFLEIIQDFAKKYHIALISQPINLNNGLEKAQALGINFFPALLMVNPATEKTRVLSYGFKSQEELLRRFMIMFNGWKPNF